MSGSTATEQPLFEAPRDGEPVKRETLALEAVRGLALVAVSKAEAVEDGFEAAGVAFLALARAVDLAPPFPFRAALYKEADSMANYLLNDDGEGSKYDHAVKEAKTMLALCELAQDRAEGQNTTD